MSRPFSFLIRSGQVFPLESLQELPLGPLCTLPTNTCIWPIKNTTIIHPFHINNHHFSSLARSEHPQNTFILTLLTPKNITNLRFSNFFRSIEIDQRHWIKQIGAPTVIFSWIVLPLHRCHIPIFYFNLFITIFLKELRNGILCFISAWSLFCLIQICVSLHFPSILLKKQAFCSAFEFNVIFKDFYNICVIIIYSMCFVILFALN